jgi:hypothetical protein
MWFGSVVTVFQEGCAASILVVEGGERGWYLSTKLRIVCRTMQSLPFCIVLQTTQSLSNHTVSVKLHALPHYTVCFTTSLSNYTPPYYILYQTTQSLPYYIVPYYTLPTYNSTKLCSLYYTTQSTKVHSLPNCTV